MNLMNGGKSEGKDYETADDPTAIPSDVHLPSSLLSDLLPTNSKRRGPLYERESSRSSSMLNGVEGYLPRNSNGSTGNESANAPLKGGHRDILHYNNYMNPYVSDMNNYSRMNGEQNYDLAMKYSVPSTMHPLNDTYPYPLDLRTKKTLQESHQDPWNVNAYAKGGAELNESNGAMTYAAALRQSQQKLSGLRDLNGKPNFKF